MIHIITVNHDARRFIECCIRAVHKFTTVPYEHIVIDNGSRPDVVQMLDSFRNIGWIKLHKRRIHKSAAGHADSLNWVLNCGFPDDKLICLLDSDAISIASDWLQKLQKRIEGVDAVGWPHFRDESLLHPACMLFRYSAWVGAGKPSFHMCTINGAFQDTGMVACRKMKESGYKISPIPCCDMNEIARHRWCGTRIENARGDKLDGKIPKKEFDAQTDKWFSDPLIIEILKHGKD